MNLLAADIESELWSAIQKHYEAGDQRGAILDAMLCLSNTIRDASGLDGDGTALVGEAFGKDVPLLKLSPLVTQSDKDVQKGTLQLLVGLYMAIRNPRSHGVVPESAEDTKAILLFINYLLRRVKAAQAPFSLQRTLRDVFDKFYTESDVYAEGLIAEIPAKHLLNVAVAVFASRERQQGTSARHFLHRLFLRLTSEEQAALSSSIADAIRETDRVSLMKWVAMILTADVFLKLPMLARLRLESMVTASLTGTSGFMGCPDTWVADHMVLYCVHLIPAFSNIEHFDFMMLVGIKQELLGIKRVARYILRYWLPVTRKSDVLRPHILTELINGNMDVYFALRDVGDDHPIWDEQLRSKFEELR